MTVSVWAWCAAGLLVVMLLALDIKASARTWRPTVRRALIASGAWLAVSVAFGSVLGIIYGGAMAEQFFTAYMLEKSLSVDNIFVFAVLFEVLAIPAVYQRRVLYYGVVGALVLRALFIAAGAALVDTLSSAFYLFGAIVVIVGVRMATAHHRPGDSESPLVSRIRRFVPVDPYYEGDRFLVHQAGRRLATPMLVALIAIEITDIVFAVDSIPAVFGVTRNVFVVCTSNVFAVLGLRSLYFVFAGAVDRLPSLRYGLAFMLVFIGAKMLLSPMLHIPTAVSLAVVAAVIGICGVAGLREKRHDPPAKVPVSSPDRAA